MRPIPLLREILGGILYQFEVNVFDAIAPQRLLSHEQLANRYRENILSIVRLTKSRGIQAILIKQPITAHERNYTSLTYEQEYQSVRDKFERSERLSFIEIFILRQYRLMEELEKIAKEENLPVVDNIKIVDQDRRRLISWVHLTAEANQRLAEALETVIKPYVLRTETTAQRAVD